MVFAFRFSGPTRAPACEGVASKGTPFPSRAVAPAGACVRPVFLQEICLLPKFQSWLFPAREEKGHPGVWQKRGLFFDPTVARWSVFGADG